LGGAKPNFDDEGEGWVYGAEEGDVFFEGVEEDECVF